MRIVGFLLLFFGSLFAGNYQEIRINDISLEVIHRLQDLGVDLELIPITSKQRIPYLETDKADLVIASMGANPGRAKSIWFSSAYAHTTIYIDKYEIFRSFRS